jgi:uncharacterized protein (TIGR02145 family)
MSATDIDGNIYPVVQIGEQCWLAENLKVSRYRNGTPIMTNLTDFEWDYAVIGAYSDMEPFGANFGKLYNWHAVADPRGICPEGWKIASNDDWQVLIDELGGDDVASGALRTVDGWLSPNTGATNSSGFSARGVGHRNYFTRQTDCCNSSAFFWTSTAHSDLMSWVRNLSNATTAVYTFSDVPEVNFHRHAMSCRCIQDASTGIGPASMEFQKPEVFPNPFTDMLNVLWEHDLPALAQVFDPSGRVLREVLLTGTRTSIQLEDLLPGMYVLRIQGKSVQGTAKIIRQQ